MAIQLNPIAQGYKNVANYIKFENYQGKWIVYKCKCYQLDNKCLLVFSDNFGRHRPWYDYYNNKIQANNRIKSLLESGYKREQLQR